MNAATLIEDLERRGVRLRMDGDRLIIDAPRGVLTDEITSVLASQKLAVLRLLSDAGEVSKPRRPLAEVAADLLPSIRFTIRETSDTCRDFDLLGRVRQVIQEFQPGGNHVYLNIITLDKRRVVVEWRALAARELRVALAHILARASEARDSEPRTP
jgi:hypothetical protein